ncbi:MAG: hypothetical protein ACPHK8_06610 [Thermoplasmatota archaeon]
MMWLMAILLLQPVFDDAGTMRLVSDADTEWMVDGESVGSTLAHEALELDVAAGAHEVVASSGTNGAWTVLARPVVAGEGATYVPAWTASSTGEVVSNDWPAWVALGLGLALVLVSRRRSLQ